MLLKPTYHAVELPCHRKIDGRLCQLFDGLSNIESSLQRVVVFSLVQPSLGMIVAMRLQLHKHIQILFRKGLFFYPEQQTAERLGQRRDVQVVVLDIFQYGALVLVMRLPSVFLAVLVITEEVVSNSRLCTSQQPRPTLEQY